MTEDLLILIGAIVGERARLGFTERQCMEQEVISRLCVRPHAHSQLTDNICRRWHEHDDFESVLKDVAVYEPPKSDRMDQGKYRLKKEVEGHEQRHTIHILIRSFNHGDYESAMQQAKSNRSPSAGQDEDARLLHPAKGLFRRLGLLLESRVLHQVLHMALHTALERREHSSSVQVNTAMWLLQAALEQRLDREAGGAQEARSRFHAAGDVAGAWGCVFASNDVVENMGAEVKRSREGGELGDLAEEPEEQSIVAMMHAMLKSEAFLDVHDAAERVVKMYGKLSDTSPHEAPLGASQNDLMGSEESTPGPAVDAKAKVRERQEALLASFAAQQKQFADAMLTDGDSEDEEMQEREEAVYECVICSVSSKPASENPMGLVSLVQRSRLMVCCHGKALHGIGLSEPNIIDPEEGAVSPPPFRVFPFDAQPPLFSV